MSLLESIFSFEKLKSLLELKLQKGNSYKAKKMTINNSINIDAKPTNDDLNKMGRPKIHAGKEEPVDAKDGDIWLKLP